MWIRCFSNWLIKDGKFDEAGSGDLVLVQLEHVAQIRRVSEGVSQVMLAGSSCNQFYVEGNPPDVLARVYANGIAARPEVAA